MAAPEYVPISPTARPRHYTSPPRRPDQWHADRPGEVVGGPQPRDGNRMGSQGPDQGYIWTLVHLVEDKIHLADGEDAHDALAGAVAVALKRASLFGRAPVVHDLTVALTVWGFLDAEPPADLVAARRRLFEGVGHLHHYPAQRAVADAVPDDVLADTPAQVTAAHAADWRSLLSL